MNAPDYLHGIIQETVNTENDTAHRSNLWAVILGLAPEQDGDQFFVLWGDNPKTGVVAFGKTPYEAMVAFDGAMYESAKRAQ